MVRGAQGHGRGVGGVIAPGNRAKMPLAGGYALYALGPLMVLSLPVVLTAINVRIPLTATQMGLVGGAESLGGVLASLAGPWWIGRVAWRPLAVFSLLVMAVGAVLTVYAASFEQLLVVRAMSSVFGGGPVYAIAIASLFQASNVDRAFAIGGGLQAALSAAFLIALPSLFAQNTAHGFIALAMAYGLGLAFVPLLGNAPIKPLPSSGAAAPARFVRPTAVLMISVMFVAGSSQTFWVFSERYGTDHGLTLEFIATLLAVSTLVSICGGAMAAHYQGRFSRQSLFFSGTAVFVATLIILTVIPTRLPFALVIMLVSFSSVFLLPFQFGALSDLNGQNAAILMPAAQSVGAVAGPTATGIVLDWGGTWSLPIATLILAMIGWLAFRAVATSQKEGQ